MRRGGKEGVTAAGGAQPEPPCPAGPAPANEAVWGFKTVTPAPPLRMPTPPPPQLTIAGKSERLPQAVAQHSHLQVHLVPEVLWARADSAPDIPGEGVVLDIRAGSEAVQEERGMTWNKVVSESHKHLSAQQLHSQQAKGLNKVSSGGLEWSKPCQLSKHLVVSCTWRN